MELPTTFVGFSSADIHHYWLMQAWKANKHIDFNFTDFELHSDVNAQNEAYVKNKCRERININDKYLVIIGQDTNIKHQFLRWEAEVALEKECTIVCVNLDGSKSMVRDTCPPIIRNVGAIFVPFCPKIVAYAIEHYVMHDDHDNYHYKYSVYESLKTDELRVN